jgi:hypothetical protein
LATADHKVEVPVAIDVDKRGESVIALQTFILTQRLIDEMMLELDFLGRPQACGSGDDQECETCDSAHGVHSGEGNDIPRDMSSANLLAEPVEITYTNPVQKANLAESLTFPGVPRNLRRGDIT